MSKISVTNRIRLVYLIVSVGGFAFIVLSLYVSELFLIALFAFVISISLYIESVRCPKCGKRVSDLRRKFSFFGPHFKGLIPKECKNCGESFE